MRNRLPYFTVIASLMSWHSWRACPPDSPPGCRWAGLL
jgi:hypothetical protein